MTEKAKTFREKLRDARPDLVAHQEKHARKRAIAIKLRALRDARGMTQDDVAKAAGMTQSMIARIEALSGPVPGLDSIGRYVAACGGQMALVISPEAIELPEAAVA